MKRNIFDISNIFFPEKVYISRKRHIFQDRILDFVRMYLLFFFYKKCLLFGKKAFLKLKKKKIIFINSLFFVKQHIFNIKC